MAIPDEAAASRQPFAEPVRVKHTRRHAAYAQFEARPIQPPPLKLLSIGGAALTSIALK